MHLATISINDINPPPHPVRAGMDETKLVELADSIKQMGVLEPLLVRQKGSRYEIVAGHRRFLASQRAGLAGVPCILLDGDPAEVDIAAKVHENLFREDLSPAEEGAFYAELFDKFGDTEAVARLCRRPLSTVERRISLLRGDPKVLNALVEKKIGVMAAECLNKCKADKDREELLYWAIRQGATVETIETWVAQRNGMAPPELRQSESDPAALVQPPPAEHKQVCFVCRQADYPERMEFWMVHDYCRSAVERQGAESEVKTDAE